MISAALPVRRTRAVLLCAVLLWASALGTPDIAHAAGCSGGKGVTVVVDYGPYGGIQTGCAADPTNGLSALSQAGFAVVQVSSQPGFVCRIDGAPPAEDDACVRTPSGTAYWSSWQAAPGSTSWTYSGSGAASTQPADGATEGWSFGSGGPPGIAPPANVAPPPPPPPGTGGRPPPNGAEPTTTTGAPAPTATGTSAGPRGSAGSTPTGTTPAESAATGAESAATETALSTAPSSGGSSSAPAGETSAVGNGPADGSDVRADPLEPSGAPWGVFVAAVVALALGSGAYWQIRRRR